MKIFTALISIALFTSSTAFSVAIQSTSGHQAPMMITHVSGQNPPFDYRGSLEKRFIHHWALPKALEYQKDRSILTPEGKHCDPRVFRSMVQYFYNHQQSDPVFRQNMETAFIQFTQQNQN